MKGLKRFGYGVLRRIRLLQGFFRFYGGKIRQWWQALGSGPRGVFARGTVLLVSVAVLWSLWIGIGALSSTLTGRRTAGTPEDSGSAIVSGTESSDGRGPVSDLWTGAVTSTGSESGGPTSVAHVDAEAETREVVASVGDLQPPAAEVSEEARPNGSLHSLALPVSGTVTQTAGWRRHVAHGFWYYEPGIELAADDPTVVAVLPGSVARIAAASAPHDGHVVVLDHGDGLLTEYKPLREVYVMPGQYVSAKAPVGRADESLVFSAYLNGESLDTEALLARD